MAFAVLCSGSVLFAEDVTRFRGENTQGKYNEPGLLDHWPEDGLKPKWVNSDLGEGWGSVIKVKDRLYLTCLDPADSNKESVVCLDLDGKKIWQQTVGGVWDRNYQVPRATPTYVIGETPGDDKLFVLSGNGTLFCLAATDGKPVWEKDVAGIYEAVIGNYGMAECVVAQDGKVFVSIYGKKAMTVALAVADGSEVWKTEPLHDLDVNCAYVTPILYENNLIVVTARYVSLIDIENGKILWQTNFEEDTGGKPPRWFPSYCSPPIIKGNQFFLSSGYGQGGAMYEILPDRKGKLLWSTKLLGSHHHGMVEVEIGRAHV
jgi:outer membrane protein assembly factor BamB